MKRLIEIFAQQKLFGDLLTLFIIGVGIFSFFSIRREVFPNVKFDIIQVVTRFSGASPAEVEQLITNPLEQDLKEIDGIKKLTSNSVEGRSIILLQLDPNMTDVDKAKSDVRDVVDGYIGELPEGAERPIIQSLETKRAPLIEVAVSGDLPLLQLRDIAKQLEKEIERIPGVAAVKPEGMEEREFRVEISMEKLSRFRISLDEVVSALRRRNIAIPGGIIEGSPDSDWKERVVRTSGQFSTPEEIEDTVIRANEIADAIRLKQIATVTETLEKPTLISRANGSRCIRLNVLRKQKSDVIDLVDALKKRIDEIKPSIDPRVHIAFINDTSEYVRRRLGVLMGNFTIGLGLVLLLLPMFLPFRFALLIAVGEPFAFLGTLLAFQFFDIGLNVISLMGLILVAGILVDDGIVVVDNVARLIKEGIPPKKAGIMGAQQIWVPVIASATTTMMAFIPLATMSGIFGKFIQYIPLGVIVPILISLFENFFVMPHHIGAWLRPQDFDFRNTRGIFGSLRRSTDQFWEKTVIPFYLVAVRWIVSHRYLLSFATFCLAVGCVLLATKVMKLVLFPPDGVEIFLIRTEMPNGTSLTATETALLPIEKEVAHLDKTELKDFVALVGLQQQDPNDPNTRRGTEYGQVMVFLTPENERDRTAAEIIEHLRKKIGTPPGMQNITFSRVRTGPPVGHPINIGLRADDYSKIVPAVAELKKIVSEVPGISDIQDNYILGKRQFDVSPRYAEASASGLSIASIGTTVRAAYEGIIATTIRLLDEEINVRVLLESAFRTKEESLQELKVANPTGSLIPLSEVATISRSQHLAFRSHENNKREIKVTAEIDTLVNSVSRANTHIAKRLKEWGDRFPGVTYHFGGEGEDTEESLQSLARAFVLALLGIFLILVLTFRTLLQPLIILLTIPLGLIGVVLTFFVHGMPLSFLGMIGMVGLSGIIANNAIVFVDFVNEARRNGANNIDSLLLAAERRARPIFLTTISTTIGVLPTAYGIGGLDKFVVPVAMAMGWGLLIGSVLTLILLPAALAILDDLTAFGRNLFAARIVSESRDR